MGNIDYMANRYQIKPDILVARLDEIKNEYKEKSEEYENVLTEKEYNRSRDRVVKNVKDLLKNINESPEVLRNYINRRLFDMNNSIDMEVNFIRSLNEILNEFIRVTDGMPLFNFQIVESEEEMKRMERKPEFHRNCLINSLLNLYRDKSNTQNKEEFNDFMIDACNHMDIDDKGLERKYLDLKARKVL